MIIDGDRDSLESLEHSQGWRILNERVKVDLDSCVNRLTNKTLALEEIRYLQGMIAALREFSGLPKALMSEMKGK